MSLPVFAVVLLAAAIHATWNALLKGTSGMLMATIFVAGTSGALSALALPFLPAPSPDCLPYLVASYVVQTGYYLLLANAYRLGDMSSTYPIMRGLAPMLVALVSWFALGERIAPLGWIGIGLVSAGILSLVLVARRPGFAPATGFALANACVIASYTVIDGAGVRAAGSLAYVLWLFVLVGGTLVLWALVTRRAEFLAAVRRSFARGASAGLGNLVSYALVVWAMTQAPIPLVAALRETSILFGTAIAALVLREQVSRWRVLAALIVAAGAVTLRLA
jgi:drug/metabolite transporter (DMT)-like permease